MATKEPTSGQPKISQKLILRTAILLFGLAILFFGLRTFLERHGDYNFGSSSTVGDVAAIETKEGGKEAVIVKPGGTVVGTSDWKSPVNDSDLAWRPDGRFLFFVSDRKDRTYNVFRWNPDGDTPEQRSIGKRGKSSPTFPADGPPDANDDMLIVGSGTVQSLDPIKMTSPQLLPPTTANITQSGDEEGGGSEGLFAAQYGPLGSSFRYARWCKGNRFIAAIMKREGGEVLILQNMTPKDGKLPKPMPVIAGSHVEFDVNPKDGSVIYVAQHFQFPDPNFVPPQFVKNNKVTVPFRHIVGVVDPDQPAQPPVAISQDDKTCFGSVAVSPDGASFLVVVGEFDPVTDSLVSKGLFSAPAKSGGMRSGAALIQGDVHEPCWAPDGSTFAFAMRKNGHRDIYTMHVDGSELKNLTGGVGDFAHPVFSPQTEASAAVK